MYLKIVCVLFPIVLALPNPETKSAEKPISVWKECARGILNPTCVKISTLIVLERLSNKDEIQLLPGLSLVQEVGDHEEKKEDITIPNSEEKLDSYVLKRLGKYLDTHSVKFKLVDSEAVNEARSMMGEARKSKLGKKGGAGTLIAMAMMMKGTLMSIGIGGLAMLAGKALMTAVISLLLSAIIGIKSLAAGGKSTTYEIVSKPVYSHSHSHSTAHEDVGNYGHSAYGRNLKPSRR